MMPMVYKILYSKNMPKKFTNKQPLTISKELWEAAVVSHLVTIEGETYGVTRVKTDLDAEISYIEVDNSLRSM